MSKTKDPLEFDYVYGLISEEKDEGAWNVGYERP